MNPCQLSAQEQQCPVSSGFICEGASERAWENHGEPSKHIIPHCVCLPSSRHHRYLH